MMKRKLLFVTLVFLAFVLTACGAQPPAADVPIINAIGQGKLTTEPDTVELRFSVVTEGKDKKIQEENAAKTQAVLDALLKLGLTKEEMETQNVNFYPLRRYDKNAGEQIVGYRAENSLVIKTKKIDKAGPIADTVVKSGAENVGSLSFSLSEEGKEALLDKAIEKAVLDARKQAEATAKAAGVKIVGIKRIEVQKQHSAPVYFEQAKLKAESRVALDTPVLPKDTEYMVSVNVSFKIQ